MVSGGLFAADEKTEPSLDDGTVGVIESNLRDARFLGVGGTL